MAAFEGAQKSALAWLVYAERRVFCRTKGTYKYKEHRHFGRVLIATIHMYRTEQYPSAERADTEDANVSASVSKVIK